MSHGLNALASENPPTPIVPTLGSSHLVPGKTAADNLVVHPGYSPDGDTTGFPSTPLVRAALPSAWLDRPAHCRLLYRFN